MAPPRAILADSSLLGARLDSIVVLVPDVGEAREILNQPNRWAIDVEWISVVGWPGRFFTLSQMESLEAAGAISDSTQIGMHRYRYPVEARTHEELMTRARELAPRTVPPGVVASASTGGEP
jgi:hypothetical protein